MPFPSVCPIDMSAANRDRARQLVLRYGWDATAFQILNPGISLWFSDYHDAVVGYVTNAGFRIVAGLPICPPRHVASVIAAFEADALHAGQRVCYFGVHEHKANMLAKRGPLARMLLGAQPVWNPQGWDSVLASKSSLRSQVSRARNKKVSVTQWNTDFANNHPGLAQCLSEWLQTRVLPPLHFLVEPDTLTCLDHRRVYVAERADSIVGFLVASPVPLRNGWLVEQIIRGYNAPNGTAELLLDTVMRDVAATGSTYITLGLSPLSRRANVAYHPHPAWLQILMAWVRAHGQRFYNFDGLDAFKAKLLPDTWEPVYAIIREHRLSWNMVYAIAGAFSGSSPVLFLSRGVLRALQREFEWLEKHVHRTIS